MVNMDWFRSTTQSDTFVKTERNLCFPLWDFYAIQYTRNLTLFTQTDNRILYASFLKITYIQRQGAANSILHQWNNAAALPMSSTFDICSSKFAFPSKCIYKVIKISHPSHLSGSHRLLSKSTLPSDCRFIRLCRKFSRAITRTHWDVMHLRTFSRLLHISKFVDAEKM